VSALFDDDEKPTSPEHRAPEKWSDDPDERLGQMLGTVSRQGKQLRDIKRDVGTLGAEVGGLRSEVGELKEKVDTFSGTLKRLGRSIVNRAAIIGGLAYAILKVLEPALGAVAKLVAHLFG